MGAKRDFALIKHGHLLGELDNVDLTGLVDNSLLQYDAASGDWQDVTLSNLNSQLDHGLLLGLADNDHPQYELVSALTEDVQDIVGAFIADSATIDFTYNDAGNSLSAIVIDDSISNAKLRNSGALSVIGRSASSSGDPADISSSSDDTLLIRTSSALSWGQLTVGMFPNDVVTYAKIQNVSATSRVLGRITAGAGDIEELTGANLATIIGTNLGANPSASVGLTAVNGTAGTYMRSDAAPALSQSISPTWTGDHIFTGAFSITNTQPEAFFNDTDAAANGKVWALYANGTHFLLSALSDNLLTEAKVFDITRSTTSLTSIAVGTVMLGVDGSAAGGPMYAFSAETNTGMFRTGTNILGFAVNGTETFRVLNDSDGRGVLCNGYMRWGNPISPSQITSDQNDYNPSGLSSAGGLRISSDASRNITGLLTANLTGRVMPILNVGSNPIVLKNENASSTAAYRFAIGADITIAANHGVVLWYDTSSLRWRCCGFY